MSTYTFKKCPHCGKTYETYTTITKHYKYHYGSPLITCGFCGQTFIDKDIKEPALEPYKEERFPLLRAIFGFLVPFGLMAIFFIGGYIQYQEPKPIGMLITGCVFAAIYLSLVIYAYSKRKSIYEKVKQEYEESEKRLSNKEYVTLLKNAGFKVPDKYL